MERKVRQQILDEYLMLSLPEVVQQGVDETYNALRVVATICYGGKEIDEFRLGMYLNAIELPIDVLLSCLRWMAGAGFIDVLCVGPHMDHEICLSEKVMNPLNDEYFHGLEEKTTESENYLIVRENIDSFTTIFWS